MKSDVSFPLENAGWPAFLVEAGGTIRHANAAAVNFFGPVMEGESVSLGAIWGEEGETAEKFLACWEHSATPVLALKFRAKGAAITTFSTYICTSKEGQKRFILQLLREPPPAAPAPPADSKIQTVESSLAHKQKLDCALQLARTVALDFNNALTSILGHTSLLLSKIESDNPWRFSLGEMQKAAEKAAEITNQLATFSNPEKESRELAAGNLNTILRRAVEALPPAKTANAACTLQLENKLYSVKFDEAKMQQAFARILDNSLEAVRDTGGRIGVSSRNLAISEPTQDRTAQLAPGSYVCLEITDDGKGMELDVLSRAFEPFFTTKHGHRGLGLALVYGIVTNHGGSLALSSQPGQGTSVRMYLPASKKLVRERELQSEELGGKQTILMVDDEDLLLNLAQAILSSFGYRVLTAPSGAKALEIVAKSKPPVDLVITDLVMPQMSGRELSAIIRIKYPGTPILLTSGYVRPAGGEEDDDCFLPKPFTSQDLLQRVKQALETTRSY